MTVTLAQLRGRAQVLADMVGSKVLMDPEFDDLVRDGIRAFWADVTSVNKDFRVNVQAFTLSTGQTIVLAADFREVRLVRKDPGTEQQQILNKLGARAGSLDCERSYRLQDRTLYIEPLVRAPGTYDLLYVPTPPLLPSPDFTVQWATAGVDINTGNYTSSGGPGPGRLMTSTIAGDPLIIDGGYPALNDRFLGKDLAAPNNNGIYTVSRLAAAGIAWQAVRATDFDEDTEIRVGQNIAVTLGAVNANTMWTVSTFGGAGIDASSLLFSASTATMFLDAEIEQHQDYIVLHAVLEALGKTESPSDTFFRLMHGVPGTQEIGARGRVMRWASDQRSADPDQVEDVRRRRTRWPR